MDRKKDSGENFGMETVELRRSDGEVIFSASGTAMPEAEADRKGFAFNAALRSGVRDFRGLSLEGAVITFPMNVDFSSADFRGAVFESCTFFGNLTYMTFLDCTFRGCLFDSMNIIGCSLYQSEMSACEFRSLAMHSVSVVSARLSNCDGFDLSLNRGSFMNVSADGIHATFSKGPVATGITRCIFLGCSIDAPKAAELFFMDCCATRCDFHNTRIPMACPSEGSFVAWKKTIRQGGERPVCSDSPEAECLTKLLIPEDARRSSSLGRKCRASHAVVLGSWTIGKNGELGEPVYETVSMMSMRPVKYVTGETVYADGFDPDRFNECSEGIHFFMDRDTAASF